MRYIYPAYHIFTKTRDFNFYLMGVLASLLRGSDAVKFTVIENPCFQFARCWRYSSVFFLLTNGHIFFGGDRAFPVETEKRFAYRKEDISADDF